MDIYEAPICVDCRFCRMPTSERDWHECGHALVSRRRSLVTGEYILLTPFSVSASCSAVREKGRECGPTGELFERATPNGKKVRAHD